MAVPFSRPEYSPSARHRRRRSYQPTTTQDPQYHNQPRRTSNASANSLASHFATGGRRSSLPLGMSLDSLSLTSRITFYALYEAWRLLQEVTRSLSSTEPAQRSSNNEDESDRANSGNHREDTNFETTVQNPDESLHREEKCLSSPLPDYTLDYDIHPGMKAASANPKFNPIYEPVVHDASIWNDIGQQIYEVSSSFEITYDEPGDVNPSKRALFDSYLNLKRSFMDSDLKKSKYLACNNGPPFIIFLSYSKTAVRQLLLSTLWFLLKKVL